MPKIVFKILTLSFEGVVIFILNLTSSAPRNHNVFHVLLSDQVIGRKSIFVGNFAIRTRDGEFAPVDQEASSPSRRGTWLR